MVFFFLSSLQTALWPITIRRHRVKKTAALLLAGLVSATVLHGQENQAAPPPAQPDIRRLRAGDDFVTLNFTNIDISALVKVMSELMRRNFILDERVTGKVTILTPNKVSPREAYQVFLSALEMKGFTVVDYGPVSRIIPAAAARQSGLKVFKDGDYSGQGFATTLIRLNYVNPNDVVRTLAPLVSRDGNILASPATDSVIVTDSVNNIRRIEKLIDALDVPVSEGKGKINVYYLKHGNAEDLAKVMAALVSRLPAPPAARKPGAPSTILEGKVTITADKATNSLIVVGSPGDFETIKDVLQKLDIRRRQVYVEAAIIEMSLNKQRELGFEFQATNVKDFDTSNKTSAIGGTNFGNIANVITGGPAGFANVSGLAVGAVKGTFKFRGQDFLNVGALLRALQTDGDVNVLSTPNILTTDNQKAEIMVGENVPFIQGQTQTAATAGTVQTLIERKDVGITLRLTPQITSDDNVKLDIYQEISSVIQTAGLNPNILGPTTSKRSASTTVVVKDRQTMVIGGLIRDNLNTTTSKVPILGDIPILGWLFKSKNTRVEKTNLMIFITPYIIKNEAEAGQVTRKQGDVLDKFRKEYRIERKGMEPVLPELPAVEESGEPGTAGKQEINGEPESAPTVTAPESVPDASFEALPGTAPTGTVPDASFETFPQSAPTGTVPDTPPEVSR